MPTLTRKVVKKPMVQAAAPEPGVLATLQPVQGLDMEPSEKLKKVCGGCRLSFSWFRTAISIDKTTKKNMADAADTNESGFSASKRLMDSKHPVIKEANELRNRIHGTWMSFTIPLAAASTEDIRVEGGTKLIRRDQIAEFDQKMKAFQPEVEAMERKLNENLEDIKAKDSDRLKGMFRNEDYPKKVGLGFSWGYPAIAVPSYLEKISPAIYQREVAAVTNRFERTFELAYLDMLQQFQAVISTWVDRLGPVVRIHPEEGNAYHNRHGAELVEKRTHETHPDSVPAGKVVAVLRRKLAGEDKQIEETLAPMSSTEFADLRPSEVGNERKVFKDSTIEGMMDMLAKFRRLGNTVSASPEFAVMVQQIEGQLAKCADSKAAAKELRDSSTYRNDTHSIMKKLGEKLSEQMETFKKMRRKIDLDVV